MPVFSLYGDLGGAAHELQPSCRCDGDGWIIVLDRGRYRAPATDDMLVVARCNCLPAVDAPERDVTARSSQRAGVASPA